ncbi:MAG: haloacid dehalogenase-like hydrolase, partial [Myxococcales bacterium]|nr:haloacid dehalogenase-like hydrolase [Myxococcales bacterium]
PLAVVEAAARRLGLDVSRVLAMTPELAGDVLAPRLARTATYAEGKLHRLREVSAGPLLAGFGDSDYDGALLEAAAVAVAVAPKAELRARMARREGPVVIVEA